MEQQYAKKKVERNSGTMIYQMGGSYIKGIAYPAFNKPAILKSCWCK